METKSYTQSDKSFHLEIITPRRVVFKGEITSFSAPGVVGGFQVLHSHAPLLSSLKVGELKITDIRGAEFHYAISGGFAEVHDNKCIILAETAERTDEIDKERAKAARERAQQRIAEKNSNVDIARAKYSLYRALNRLKIAGVS